MPVDNSGAGPLESITQDLRFAARVLRRRPAFTAVAVLTLAVGIGATVAIFSAVDAMLLRRLPFREPERLMTVSLTTAARRDVWSVAKFAVFRDAQTIYENLTLYGAWQTTLRGGDGAERLHAEVTDARYLPTLGLRPARGRNFAADEDRAPGGPKVVLLGDALWRRRFAADPGVISRTIDLDGDRYTVIGVMPPGFRGLTGRAELWTTIVSGQPITVNQPGSTRSLSSPVSSLGSRPSARSSRRNSSAAASTRSTRVTGVSIGAPPRATSTRTE